MKTLKNFISEAISQTKLKRASVRSSKSPTTHPDSNPHKLTIDNAVGWFSNKYNPSGGWSLHELSSQEKREFGSDKVFRSLSMNRTSIVKIDVVKGSYAFIDNEHLMNTDKIKFEKMTAYRDLRIDFNKKAFIAFNLELPMVFK